MQKVKELLLGSTDEELRRVVEAKAWHSAKSNWTHASESYSPNQPGCLLYHLSGGRYCDKRYGEGGWKMQMRSDHTGRWTEFVQLAPDGLPHSAELEYMSLASKVGQGAAANAVQQMAAKILAARQPKAFFENAIRIPRKATSAVALGVLALMSSIGLLACF